ncbi:MAG: cupin domain-containing protein, partial [Gemmatimonadales bacterium]|nr:cupin domain-containing protein [Gemmatimonadales bacterium]
MTVVVLADVAERELARGFHARFVHSERMTLAFWRVIDGATLPTHA